jgi:hypothetical protein
MKVFNKREPFENKVNFVDEHNVCVGYDLTQDCCEDSGWFIADKISCEIQDTPAQVELEAWSFDKYFFAELKINKLNEDQSEQNMVIFRMTNGDKAQFLHLYNCHNGYYDHGFCFEESGNPFPIIKGKL